jgi:hypothetical protein
MEAVKLPSPLPAVFLLVNMVGLRDVPQHTPRSVTKRPLAEETVPPELTDWEPRLKTEAVVTLIFVPKPVGGAGFFVHENIKTKNDMLISRRII